VRDEGAGKVGDPDLRGVALLSVLTQADGYIVIAEEAAGLDASVEVDVTFYTEAVVRRTRTFRPPPGGVSGLLHDRGSLATSRYRWRPTIMPNGLRPS